MHKNRSEQQQALQGHLAHTKLWAETHAAEHKELQAKEKSKFQKSNIKIKFCDLQMTISVKGIRNCGYSVYDYASILTKSSKSCGMCQSL